MRSGLTILVAIVMVSELVAPHMMMVSGARHCILPLGDSLTQGVGDYGAYRYVLKKKFTEDSKQDVGFIGSQLHTCTPKFPGKPFAKGKFGPLAHEGHCGFSSARLLKELPTSFASQEFRDSLDAADGCTAISVLLLIGHNDAFQVAKLCKILEGAKKGGESCAQNHLRELKANLRSIVELVTTNLQKPSVGSASKLPPLHFYLGENPSTGFPVIQSEIVTILKSTVESLTEAWVGHGAPSIQLVRFPGWTIGKDTFDTTHPNQHGCELMANSWYAAMKAQVEAATTALREMGPDDLIPSNAPSVEAQPSLEAGPQRTSSLASGAGKGGSRTAVYFPQHLPEVGVGVNWMPFLVMTVVVGLVMLLNRRRRVVA